MNCSENRSPCPIANALDLFGDRWTLLVLRDILLFGKHRHREFLGSPEGIASNILAERLKRLETAGLISREPDPDDRRQVIYSATEKGRTLTPLLGQIADWAAKELKDPAAEDRPATPDARR